MTVLERMQAKHKTAVDDVTRQREKRDKAIDVLLRAETRYRKAVKAVARSQKRLDKARKDDKLAKLAGKQAKAESRATTPDIAAALLSG